MLFVLVQRPKLQLFNSRIQPRLKAVCVKLEFLLALLWNAAIVLVADIPPVLMLWWQVTIISPLMTTRSRTVFFSHLMQG